MNELVPLAQEFGQIKALVANSVRSPHSRRAYLKALDGFFAWYTALPQSGFTKALVQEYRAHLEAAGLAPSTINVQLAAIRKLAAEAADNGFLDPQLAAGILRIRGIRRLGVRVGNWLTRDQVRALLEVPDPRTLKGKRDRAILALLIGCGLRRSELLALTADMLQQREGRWVIPDLPGKGGRLRTLPVPTWVKAAIDGWTRAAGISQGCLFRAVTRGGHLHGEALTEKAVWSVVDEYATRIGLAKLSPHDLRRTCAKLCRASGGDLEQIQLLLGHASVQTTERYLGTRQNLVEAVNDRLGIFE